MHAVALKLPTFWAEQPKIWFAQAEAQFALREITKETTKFYHVVSALDQQTAGRLLDVLDAPPQGDSYTALKSRLLQTYGLGRRERATKLLHMSGLGDRKPSALMDEMLSLLDGHESCFLFESLFLEQLPEDLRLQLADDAFTDPRKLAAKADILWQAKTTPPQEIGKVSAQRPPTTRTSTTHATTRDGTRPTPKKTPAETSGMCWYHAKFGSRAWQCQPPCNFTTTGNANAGSR